MLYDIIILEFSIFFYISCDYMTITYITVVTVKCNIILTPNSKSKIKLNKIKINKVHHFQF